MIIILQGSRIKGPFTNELKVTHYDVEKWETLLLKDLDPRSIYKITFAISLYEGNIHNFFVLERLLCIFCI